MRQETDSFARCPNKNVKIRTLGVLYNAQSKLENIPCVISVSSYDFENYLQGLWTRVEF